MRLMMLRLLALMLVPVLVLNTPGAADAATVEQVDAVAWSQPGTDWPYVTVNCTGTVKSTTSTTSVQLAVTGLNCAGGIDLSPGMSQIAEPGSTFTAWVTGPNCGGSAGGTFGAGPDDGFGTVNGYHAGVSWEGGPPTCDPEQACLKLDGAGLASVTMCAAVALDPTTATEEAPVCAYGSVARPEVSAIKPQYMSDGSAVRTSRDWTFRWTQQELGPANWFHYRVYRRLDGSVFWRGTEVTIPSTQPKTVVGEATSGYTATLSESDRPIGGGYTRRASNNGKIFTALYPTGTVGVNEPDKCNFYWGEKIVEVAGSDIDEPLSPIYPGANGPAPVPVPPAYDPGAPAEDSSCQTFSFTDPGTWGGAASCMMVALLGKLIDAVVSVANAVGGVATSILSGLGAVLQALFVPEPDSWGFDGLLDQFQTRPPGSVVMGIGDGLLSFRDGYSGAGCGTLADFSSEDIDASVTCSQVKSIPGYGALYGLVQIGLFALTGLAVFRMMAGKVGGDT